MPGRVGGRLTGKGPTISGRSRSIHPLADLVRPDELLLLLGGDLLTLGNQHRGVDDPPLGLVGRDGGGLVHHPEGARPGLGERQRRVVDEEDAGVAWLGLQSIPAAHVGVRQARWGGGIAARDFSPGVHASLRPLDVWYTLDARTRVVAFAHRSDGGSALIRSALNVEQASSTTFPAASRTCGLATPTKVSLPVRVILALSLSVPTKFPSASKCPPW